MREYKRKGNQNLFFNIQIMKVQLDAKEQYIKMYACTISLIGNENDRC